MIKHLTNWLSLFKDTKGSAAVEFALVAPTFFLVIFGILDFSRAMWYVSTIEHAASEGARYAAVRGAEKSSPATETEIKAFAVNRAPGMALSNTDVQVTWQPDNTSGSSVNVQVSYQFDFMAVGFLPIDPVQLQGTSTLVVN